MFVTIFRASENRRFRVSRRIFRNKERTYRFRSRTKSVTQSYSRRTNDREKSFARRNGTELRYARRTRFVIPYVCSYINDGCAYNKRRSIYDVPAVKHVAFRPIISIPEHRSGRTGRAGYNLGAGRRYSNGCR